MIGPAPRRHGRIVALFAMLAVAGCTSSAQTGPAPSLRNVTWVAEDIGGRGVVDRVQSTVRFGDDGRLTGNGGCNGMFGTYEAGADTLRIGPIGATKKACPPAVMDQEGKFFAALQGARSYTFDRNGFLTITGAAGAVRFAPGTTPTPPR
jgi:heat shock protein HslJ